MDALEAAEVGSVWLPEMVCGSLAGSFIGMAPRAGPDVPAEGGDGVAVGLGTTRCWWPRSSPPWPGLAARRVLPVFGLKPARPAEQAAFSMPRKSESAVFDNAKAF